MFVFQSIDCIKPSIENIWYLDIYSLGNSQWLSVCLVELKTWFVVKLKKFVNRHEKVCLDNNTYFRLLQFGSYWACSTMYPNKMFRLNFHCFQLKIIGFTTSYLEDIQYCLVGFLLNKWFSSLFFLASENRIDKQNNQISCWENAF